MGLFELDERVPPLLVQAYEVTGPEVTAVYDPEPPAIMEEDPEIYMQSILGVVVTTLAGQAATPP